MAIKGSQILRTEIINNKECYGKHCNIVKEETKYVKIDPHCYQMIHIPQQNRELVIGSF